MGWERKPAWESLCTVIEPQINADGVHEWPFDPMFPIDVRHFRLEGYDDIRMNRHRYLELVYVHSGEAHCEIQGRCFVAAPGDLLVIGRDCFHHVFDPHRRPMKLVVLYFQPELIAYTQASRREPGIPYAVPHAGLEPGAARAGEGGNSGAGAGFHATHRFPVATPVDPGSHLGEDLPPIHSCASVKHSQGSPVGTKT